MKRGILKAGLAVGLVMGARAHRPRGSPGSREEMRGGCRAGRAGLPGQVRGKRMACTQSDHDECAPGEKDPAGKSDRGRSDGGRSNAARHGGRRLRAVYGQRRELRQRHLRREPAVGAPRGERHVVPGAGSVRQCRTTPMLNPPERPDGERSCPTLSGRRGGTASDGLRPDEGWNHDPLPGGRRRAGLGGTSSTSHGEISEALEALTAETMLVLVLARISTGATIRRPISSTGCSGVARNRRAYSSSGAIARWTSSSRGIPCGRCSRSSGLGNRMAPSTPSTKDCAWRIKSAMCTWPVFCARRRPRCTAKRSISPARQRSHAKSCSALGSRIAPVRARCSRWHSRSSVLVGSTRRSRHRGRADATGPRGAATGRD